MALVAAAIALPSIQNEFAHDDHWIVAQRSLLREPTSLGAVLAEPYWPAGFGGGLWRPAVLASFALDYRISDSPHWFHATNIIWTALSAGVLALLAGMVGGPRIGLVTGALFAVHPAHVEATASIVGRAELMAAAGYGMALVSALAAERDRRYLIGVGLAAALAIGSKEHAATLPAAVLLLYLAQRGTPRRAGEAALTAAAPIALYFLLRGAVTGDALGAGGIAPGLAGLSFLERGWAMIALSVEWWRLLFVPIHLSADYSPGELAVSTALTARHVLGLVLWLAFAFLAWRFRARTALLGVGVGWIALTLLPASNLLVPTEILVAERTLYLPSWGAMLAVAATVELVGWSRGATATVAVIALVGAGRSMARVKDWRDDGAVLTALERDAPRSYRTLWLQGVDAFRREQWGTGEQLLRQAISAAPELPGPREELAGYYAQADFWEPAVQLLRESIAADSSRVRPWALLPIAVINAGDTLTAALLAEQADTRFPRSDQISQNALAVLVAAGRCDQAEALAQRFFSRVPAGVPIDSTELVSRCR